MKLYIGDYLADTRHLSAEEHGAYLLLIMHLFRTGQIPSSEKQKAEIASTTMRRWPKVRHTIERFFVVLPDGCWTHNRVQKEVRQLSLTSQKRGEYGRKGGLKTQENFRAKARNQLEQNSTYQTSESEKKIPSGSIYAKQAKKRATQIPDNFNLTEERRQPARELGWPEHRIDSEFNRFCDSARAKGRTYIDWDAAWRNWITSPLQAKGNSNGYRKQHASERAFEIADELDRALECQTNAARDHSGGGPDVVSLLEWQRPA